MSPISTPRFRERSITLETYFDISLMNKVWRKIVKLGMRNQDLFCLHDYYDFHRNHEALNLCLSGAVIQVR